MHIKNANTGHLLIALYPQNPYVDCVHHNRTGISANRDRGCDMYK